MLKSPMYVADHQFVKVLHCYKRKSRSFQDITERIQYHGVYRCVASSSVVDVNGYARERAPVLRTLIDSIRPQCVGHFM